MKIESRECIRNILESSPPEENEQVIDLSDSETCLLDDSVASKETKLCIPPYMKQRSTFETFRKYLPVFDYREEILDTIRTNQAAIICGETGNNFKDKSEITIKLINILLLSYTDIITKGSGKSTQVPQYILEECAVERKECRIICTQPRRLAATSIAERVAQERMEKVGNVVGYQIRMNSCVSKKTNLIYTTSGYLLQCLLHEKASSFFKNITHLILDEIHEREKITDFLLITIRDVIKEKNLPMKIILMSATLETEIFSNYFDNCSIINVPGRCFPVDVFHLAEIMEIIDNDKTVQMILNENQEISSKNRNDIDHMLLYSLIKYIHQNKAINESLLIFLPGYEDIATQKDIIESEIYTQDYELFILHSSMQTLSNCDQNRVFQRTTNEKRKIILSTNIAEASVTIDDVVYVIDVGKVKQSNYDSVTETSGLECTWISQACAKQRSGRAGRTRKGQCYRLYSVEQYEKFQKFSTPEMLRTPLTDICLFCASLAAENKESIEELLQRAIEPPSVTVIQQSMALLKSMGALSELEDLTVLGRKLIQLPVDVRLGKCLLYGIFLQCFDPVLTIISCLSIHDPFQIQTDSDHQTIYSIKMDFNRGKQSDPLMMLHVFNEWLSCKQLYQEKFFSFLNSINNGNMERINDIRALILSHLRQVSLLGTENRKILNKNSSNYSIIKACLTAGLYPNICQIDCQSGRILSKQNAKVHIHTGSVLSGTALDRGNYHVPMEWIVYGEKLQMSYFFVIRNNTVTMPINVALFAGPINLNENSIFPFEQPQHKQRRKPDLTEDAELVYFWLDDWIHFILKKKDAELIYALRQKVNKIFVKFLETPFKHILDENETKVLNALFYVINQENNVVNSLLRKDNC